MIRLDINNLERSFLICELAERIRDLAYMNARKRAEEVIDNLLKAWKDKDVDPNTQIEVNLHYQFLVNDLIQILGRYRRMKGGLKHAEEKGN
jgi:hypothetical protein